MSAGTGPENQRFSGSSRAASSRIRAASPWPKAGASPICPQDGVVASDRPLHEEVLSVFAEVLALEERQRDLEARMRRMAPNGPELSRLIDEHHALQSEFERRDGFTVEAKVGAVLGGLGFSQADYGRAVSEYSGGWQMRVALAKLLLQEADLLLLDEPTDRLDLTAVEWLEEYIQKYRGSVVIVSHDRYFLERATTRTLELADGRVTSYPGRYSWYVEERARRMASQQGAFKQQQEYITEQTAYIEKFRYNNRRASLVKSQGEDAREARARRGAARGVPELAFRLPAAPPSGDEVAALRGVDKAYGENQVIRRVDVLVRRGEKVALVGPNGSGKSTLLRLLSRVERPDRGFLVYGPAVQVRLLRPELRREPEPTQLGSRGSLRRRTPGDYTLPDSIAARPIPVPTGRSVQVGVGAFRGRESGSRSKCCSGRPICSSSTSQPTTWTSPPRKSSRRLCETYPGTVVVASHDRYFLDRFVTRTLEVRDGGVAEYLGNYTYYRERKEADGCRAGANADRGGRGAAAHSRPIRREGRARDRGERSACPSCVAEGASGRGV